MRKLLMHENKWTKKEMRVQLELKFKMASKNCPSSLSLSHTISVRLNYKRDKLNIQIIFQVLKFNSDILFFVLFFVFLIFIVSFF